MTKKVKEKVFERLLLKHGDYLVENFDKITFTTLNEMFVDAVDFSIEEINREANKPTQKVDSLGESATGGRT